MCCQADISSEGDGDSEREGDSDNDGDSDIEGEGDRDGSDGEQERDIDIDFEAIIPHSFVAQKYSLKLILPIKAFILELILCIILFCIKY